MIAFMSLHFFEDKDMAVFHLSQLEKLNDNRYYTNLLRYRFALHDLIQELGEAKRNVFH